MDKHRVILDTDIGDDVDDAFALALLLRSPEVELKGVVTVCGQTERRAEIVTALLAATNTPDVPVLAGCGGTMASRPLRTNADTEIRYGPVVPGWEARLHRTAQGSTYFIERLLLDVEDAATTTSLLAIGPLTNVAVALTANAIEHWNARLVLMAGEFQRERFVEHNVRCDPEAAHLVFASGLPIDVIPWSIGPATRLSDADVKRLEASDDRLVKLLVDWLHQFWRHVPGKTNMYDPMTVVALLRPDLFDWRRGRVSVELRDDGLYGLTRFEADESGHHRVAFGVKADEAKAFMLDRILGG